MAKFFRYLVSLVAHAAWQRSGKAGSLPAFKAARGQPTTRLPVPSAWQIMAATWILERLWQAFGDDVKYKVTHTKSPVVNRLGEMLPAPGDATKAPPSTIQRCASVAAYRANGAAIRHAKTAARYVADRLSAGFAAFVIKIYIVNAVEIRFLMRSFVLRLALLHPAFRNSRGRRTGQALLLAVLLMVFAAIIGTTFITVVALNMDATATQEERQRAASAAAAGAQVVNYQINANGTDWRPEHISPPPAPGDPEYSYYWTAQDLAHGFARSTPHPTGWNPTAPDYAADWAALEAGKAAGQPVFVKFPDPRLEQNTGSHTYMVEVARATSLDGTDKAGMLRITVVGQSSDDPNVFVKRVGYKGTSENGGAFAWDQFLTNWNYKNTQQGLSEARLSATATVGTNTINVTDVSGFAPGRLILLQKGTQLEQNIIQDIGTGNTIQLKNNLSATFDMTTPIPTVRVANSFIDSLPGAESSSVVPMLFDADDFGPNGQAHDRVPIKNRIIPFGIYSNSDLTFRGNSRVRMSATAKLLTAGLILADNTQTQAQMNDGTNTFVVPTSNSATTQVGSGTLPYPMQKQVFDNPSITTNVTETSTDQNRSVKPMTPPDLTAFNRHLEMTKYQPNGVYGYGPGLYINNPEDTEKVYDSGKLRPLEIFEMHRLWEGKSFKSTPGSGNAAAADPVGQIPTGTVTHRLSFPRFLSVTQNIDSYTYPLNVNTATLSLEQKGIRGWVSPSEFRARGVEIVFDGDKAQVTLEDRADANGNPNANVPDPSKAWRLPNGAAFPAPVVGVTSDSYKNYRMALDYSLPNVTTRTFGVTSVSTSQNVYSGRFNGVIYAEGNVRVRGKIGSRDITIVSMGNIYVEGNLTRSGVGRVALLARKNVVLNPTQFVTRLRGAQDRDVADRIINDTTVPPTIVNASPGYAVQVAAVTNPSTIVLNSATPDPLGPVAAFRMGDMVRIGNDTEWRTIVRFGTTVGPAPDTIVLQTNTVGVNAGDRVRLLSDPRIESGRNTNLFTAAPTTPPPTPPSTVSIERRLPEWFYRAADNEKGDVFVRDVRLDGLTPPTTGYFGVATNAVGELRPGVTLEWTKPNPTPTPPPVTYDNLPGTYNVLVKNTGDVDQYFSITGTPNPATAPSFNITPGYKLNDLVAPAGYSGDNVETVEAWKNALSTDQAAITEPNKWALTYPTAVAAYAGHPETNYVPAGAADTNRLPARFMARWVPTAGLTPTNPYGPINNNLANGRPYGQAAQLPLSVSAGISWITGPIGGWNPYSVPSGGFSTLKYLLGSAWLPTSSTLLPATYDIAPYNADEAETSRADFYAYQAGATLRQQWLRPFYYPLSYPVAATPDGINNVIAVTRNPVADTHSATEKALLPPLRASGWMKVEQDNFNSTPHTFSAVPLTVQATIFAQEGSWFVIPAFAQYRPDIDHGGTVLAAERAVATRMRRLNYKVTVVGTIAQNFTPLVETDYDNEETPYEFASTVLYTRGPMAEWLDAQSSPTNITASGGRGIGSDWTNIIYQSDPGGLVPVSSGLILPPSPELSFVG